MAGIKDIKNRISSIQNTSKITKAMKMVAAAKIKKAENTVKSGRPFAEELSHLFEKLVSSVSEFTVSDLKVVRALDNYPALLNRNEIKTEGLLIITSNKGLAGAYNSNVIKAALNRVKENSENGIKTVIYPVGQKAISALRRKAENFKLKKGYINAANNPSVIEAEVIAEDIAEDFVSGNVDKIDVITTCFKNMMSYQVISREILPVKAERTGVVDPLMEFEPSPHSVLQKLVPMYITNAIYQSLLEAHASELASRMTAMSAASKNAEEIINTLTVDYNKARQGAITQELIEVISGRQD